MTQPVPTPATPVERALVSWLRARVVARRPIGRRFVFSIPIDPTGTLPYFLTIWQWRESDRYFDVLEGAVVESGGVRANVWNELVSQWTAAAPGALQFTATIVGDELELVVPPESPPLLVEWGPTLELADAVAGDDRHVSRVILGRPGAPTPIGKDDNDVELLPTPEYWVVTGGTRRAHGEDDQGLPNAVLEYVENVGTRTETLDLTVISPRADRLATLFRGAAMDVGVELVELSKLGLGIVDIRTIVDGSVELSTMWQRRAALSVEVSFSERTLIDARDRINETVEATGEVVGLPPTTITEP